MSRPRRLALFAPLLGCLLLASPVLRAAPVAPAPASAPQATPRTAPASAPEATPRPAPASAPQATPRPAPASVPQASLLLPDRTGGHPHAQGWFHRSYWLDWGLVLGVAGTTVGLYVGTKPHVGSFRVDDPRISRSHREDTVPDWALAFAAVLPLATAGLAQIWERSGQDLHHAVLGLAEGMGLTFLVTVILKNAVGRLRPDFLDRCQPDPQGQCTGDPDLVRKGRDSFPSGHTSIFFAGGVYMSLYLWGKLKPGREGGALWKILAILTPVVAATLVGVSRITDHRHHWEDVLVGGLLGTGFAYLGYRLHYPDPWSKDAGTPKRRNRWAAFPVVGPGTLALMAQGEF